MLSSIANRVPHSSLKTKNGDADPALGPSAHRPPPGVVDPPFSLSFTSCSDDAHPTPASDRRRFRSAQLWSLCLVDADGWRAEAERSAAAERTASGTAAGADRRRSCDVATLWPGLPPTQMSGPSPPGGAAQGEMSRGGPGRASLAAPALTPPRGGDRHDAAAGPSPPPTLAPLAREWLDEVARWLGAPSDGPAAAATGFESADQHRLWLAAGGLLGAGGGGETSTSSVGAAGMRLDFPQTAGTFLLCGLAARPPCRLVVRGDGTSGDSDSDSAAVRLAAARANAAAVPTVVAAEGCWTPADAPRPEAGAGGGGGAAGRRRRAAAGAGGGPGLPTGAAASPPRGAGGGEGPSGASIHRVTGDGARSAGPVADPVVEGRTLARAARAAVAVLEGAAGWRGSLLRSVAASPPPPPPTAPPHLLATRLGAAAASVSADATVRVRAATARLDASKRLSRAAYASAAAATDDVDAAALRADLARARALVSEARRVVAGSVLGRLSGCDPRTGAPDGGGGGDDPHPLMSASLALCRAGAAACAVGSAPPGGRGADAGDGAGDVDAPPVAPPAAFELASAGALLWRSTLHVGWALARCDAADAALSSGGEGGGGEEGAESADEAAETTADGGGGGAGGGAPGAGGGAPGRGGGAPAGGDRRLRRLRALDAARRDRGSAWAAATAFRVAGLSSELSCSATISVAIFRSPSRHCAVFPPDRRHPRP